MAFHDRAVFKSRTNGEPDHNSLNGKLIRGTARWEGEELVIESWLQAGPGELHSAIAGFFPLKGRL
jgi:hypothetical protein